MYLETTPDTSGYMIAGFVVAFATMGLYLLSMSLRRRNLARDLEAIQRLKPAPAPKPARPKPRGKPARKSNKK